VCFGIAALAVCDIFLSIDELEISPRAVRSDRLLFGRWVMSGGRLPASQLEDVLVNTALSGETHRTTVQFVGKTETIEFGYGRRITKEDKRILAQCARTVLGAPNRRDRANAPRV
jgi:hypothetical protein